MKMRYRDYIRMDLAISVLFAITYPKLHVTDYFKPYVKLNGALGKVLTTVPEGAVLDLLNTYDPVIKNTGRTIHPVYKSLLSGATSEERAAAREHMNLVIGGVLSQVENSIINKVRLKKLNPEFNHSLTQVYSALVSSTTKLLAR